jgi:hypothetical protein
MLTTEFRFVCDTFDDKLDSLEKPFQNSDVDNGGAVLTSWESKNTDPLQHRCVRRTEMNGSNLSFLQWTFPDM